MMLRYSPQVEELADFFLARPNEIIPNDKIALQIWGVGKDLPENWRKDFYSLIGKTKRYLRDNHGMWLQNYPGQGYLLAHTPWRKVQCHITYKNRGKILTKISQSVLKLVPENQISEDQKAMLKNLISATEKLVQEFAAPSDAQFHLNEALKALEPPKKEEDSEE